jgi:erythronate-4-phosphate dehydrogenase
MKTVATDDIPYAGEAFGVLGGMRVVPAREMSKGLVADADLLIVRSTTKVDEQLLAGGNVRFVGSAVAGTDHVDRDWLARQGIPFAGAAGCNANSVAEYVTAALLELAARGGYELGGRSIGVVGVGNVGSRVAAKAEALGMTVIPNDPPLQRRTGEARFRPIEEAKAADFVTLHVPLTREGPDATRHMVDGRWLEGMKPGAVLLNTSRGAVVEEAALISAARSARVGALVLDVYENEPAISPEPVRAADIATPHIAGHSFDGKVAGTAVIYEAACRMLGREPAVDVLSLMPKPPVPELTVTGGGAIEEIVRRTVRSVYDITADDARLRKAAEAGPHDVAQAFGALRKSYPIRREFHNTTLRFEGCAAEARRKLLALGFRDEKD